MARPIGFKSEETSGTGAEGASLCTGAESDEEELPIISDKSSSRAGFSSIAAITSSDGSGIPTTKSSESSTSLIPLGIGREPTFSPRFERSSASLPRERISELNFLS